MSDRSRFSRRRFLRTAGAAAVAGAGGVAGCLERLPRPPLAESADALFRGNLRRHGDQRDRSIPDAVTRDWRFDGVNRGDHTAAKASAVPAPTGDLIVPGDAGVVYAVSPGGQVRWRATVEPTIRGIHGTPAIANDTVYVGAYDGALYAFDLYTGARRWRTKLGDAIGSSPAYHDGTVYIAVEFYDPSGAVFGVNARTGAVEWADHRPTDHPHSTPAIDLDADRLVVGSNDGRLYAWEYPSLSFAWTFDTGRPIKGPIATDDGAAFFGSWDHHVYRVDLDDGTMDWSFETGADVMSGPAVDPTAGTLYIGSHDGGVYALDATTGEYRWTFDTGGKVIGCPTITREGVLVGSYDRHLYALDRSTGDERWRARATGWVSSTPLVYDGGVYFTDRADGGRPGGLYRLAPAG